jgi:hypothetical protein
MKLLLFLKNFCEYLEGARDELPANAPGFIAAWWWRGLWWTFLAALILSFCGQTSKFIYIDF